MGGGGEDTGSTRDTAVDRTTTDLLSRLRTQVGQGTAVYDQPLYTGMSGWTRGGLNNLSQTATNGQQGLNDAYGWATDTIGNGLDATQRGAIGSVGQMANTAQNPSLTESTLMNVARGGAFGTADPGYQRLRANAADDTLSTINSAFNASGRFGGGSNMETAGEGVTNAIAGMDYQNYQNDIGRQERALGAIEGQRQQGWTNRMGALGTQFGMSQTGADNSARAAGMAPGLFDATLRPAQTRVETGQMIDADALARRQSDNDLFRRQNDAGWTTLERASGILNGNAGAGGSEPQVPWWQSLAGGAIGLGSMFL
jgi:hypothetical protein